MSLENNSVILKYRGRITQFIKWEDRQKEFDVVANDGEYDFITISHRPIIKSFFKKILAEFTQPPLSPETHIASLGINAWIKRPHNFKLGDNIDIDTKISISANPFYF